MSAASAETITLSYQPTLVVGLGGTGTAVVRQLAERVIWRYGSLSEAPHMRFLVLDTCEQDVRKFRETLPELSDNTFALSPNEQEFMRAQRDLAHCSEIGLQEWGDGELLRKVENPAGGAAGIRMVGRWCFLWSDYFPKILSATKQLVNDLKSLREGDFLGTDRVGTIAARHGDVRVAPSSRPLIWVVASSVGGTGAGSFIDFGYMLRRVQEEIGPGFDAYAILLTASSVTTSNAMALGNTAAVLDELDFLHAAKWQQVRHKPGYEREMFQTPYDRTFLVSTVSSDATNLSADPYGTACDRIASFIYSNTSHGSTEEADVAARVQDFGPSMAAADSEGRMPAFYTFGVRTIEYPSETVHKGVVSKVLLELTSQWSRPATWEDASRQDRADILSLLGVYAAETGGGATGLSDQGGPSAAFLGDATWLTRLADLPAAERLWPTTIGARSYQAETVQQALAAEIEAGVSQLTQPGPGISGLIEAEGNAEIWLGEAPPASAAGPSPAWVSGYLERQLKRAKAEGEARLLAWVESVVWDYSRGLGYARTLLEGARSRAEAFVRDVLRREADGDVTPPDEDKFVRQAFEAREDPIAKGLLAFTGSASRIANHHANLARGELTRYFQDRLASLTAKRKIELLEALVLREDSVLGRLSRRLANLADYLASAYRPEREADLDRFREDADRKALGNAAIRVTLEDIDHYARQFLGYDLGLEPAETARHQASLFERLASEHLGVRPGGPRDADTVGAHVFRKPLSRDGESALDGAYQARDAAPMFRGLTAAVRRYFIGTSPVPLGAEAEAALRSRIALEDLMERLNVYAVSALDRFRDTAHKEHQRWEDKLQAAIREALPMLPMNFNLHSYASVASRPSRAGFWGICPVRARDEQGIENPDWATVRRLMVNVQNEMAGSGLTDGKYPVLLPTSQLERGRMSFILIQGAVTTDVIQGYAASEPGQGTSFRDERVRALHVRPYSSVRPWFLPPRAQLRKASQLYLMARILEVFKPVTQRYELALPPTEHEQAKTLRLSRDLMRGALELIREPGALTRLQNDLLDRKIEALGGGQSPALARLIFWDTFGVRYVEEDLGPGVEAPALVERLNIHRIRGAVGLEDEALASGRSAIELELQVAKQIVFDYLESRDWLMEHVLRQKSRPASFNVQALAPDGPWQCVVCRARFDEPEEVRAGAKCGNCGVEFF